MKNESNSFGQLLIKACKETTHSSVGDLSFDNSSFNDGSIGYKPINIDQMKNLAYNFNQVLKNKKTYVESRTDKETVLLTIVDHPKEYHYNNGDFLDKRFSDDIKVYDADNTKIINFSFDKYRLFNSEFDNKLKNNRYYTTTNLSKDEVKSIISTITVDELDCLERTCRNCDLDSFRNVNPWFKLPEIHINFLQKTSQCNMNQIVLPLTNVRCGSLIYNLDFYKEIAYKKIPNTKLVFSCRVSLNTMNYENSVINIIISESSDLSYKNGDKINKVTNDVICLVKNVTLTLPDERPIMKSSDKYKNECVIKEFNETEQKNYCENNEFVFNNLSDDIVKYLTDFAKNGKSDIKIIPKLTLYSDKTMYIGYFTVNKSECYIDNRCLKFDGKETYDHCYRVKFIVTCKSNIDNENINCLVNLSYSKYNNGMIGLSQCKVKICDKQEIKFYKASLNIDIDDTSISDQKYTYITHYTDGDMVDVLDFVHFCLSVSPVYRYAFLTELNALYFPKIEQCIQKIDINFLHGGSDLDEGDIEKVIIRTKIVR